jgi:hypothetical protein
MSTVQMDAGSAARLRDEILRKKAQQAGGEPQPRRKRTRRPRPQSSDRAYPAAPEQRLVPPAALAATAAGAQPRS